MMARNSDCRFGAFYLSMGSKSTRCSCDENYERNSQGNNKTFLETTQLLQFAVVEESDCYRRSWAELCSSNR